MPLTDRFIYKSPFGLSNPIMQSMLSRSKFRMRGRNEMLQSSVEEILTTDEGAKLQGYVSKHNDQIKGMVILLPGWEGSAHSSYMLCTGRSLYDAGYDVYRLNYRDHGKTHKMNEGIFHGALTAEVGDVVTQWARRGIPGKVFIAGFSLGGNFALRMCTLPIPGLKMGFAISPVLDPLESTTLLDNNPVFHNYFREKWSKSLRLKEEYFPDRYDFSELLGEESIIRMTEMLLEQYTEFKSLEHYFDHYKLTADRLTALSTPAWLITSLDDPVLAVKDFAPYSDLPLLNLSVQQRGGHVGFLTPTLRTSW